MHHLHCLRPMKAKHATILAALLLLSMLPAAPAESTTPDVRISEVLASASSEAYNGTDWNGDGVIGNPSDQFIEIWNAGTETVDVSDWWLDDRIGSGSPPCRLPWNTVLQPNERIVVFRADSGLELDYFGGDEVSLLTADGTFVDGMAWPDQDSWWDRPYIPLDNGTLWKDNAPTPGAHENATVTGPVAGLRCYTSADHLHSGSYVLKGRLVTMDADGTVHNDGSILVQDGVIEAVWNGPAPADLILEGVPVHSTGATIYPGLIDLHNHLHYNTAPLWPVEPHVTPNQWGGYDNRYQWKDHPDYSGMVTKPKMLLHGGPYFDLEQAAMKYVEAKAIVGGTTATQGAPSTPDEAWSDLLTRNVELWNFGRDEIHTKVTELTSDYVGNHIKTGNASGELDAWFLHLAEGVDERSRAEFDVLEANGLLVGELVVIHGTALTATEFEAMADVGASLVWSPLSNLLLYGSTTDVAAAKAAGVRIALAPDWSPSGSKSPLHELKVADLWDDEVLGDIFSDEDLVRMVTSTAAAATGWSADVGTLAVGSAADLVVVDTIDADPYRNLIRAVDPDVRLSVVAGMPLYGDADLMEAMRGTDHEDAGRFGKRIDVTASAVDDGFRSWASIVDDLSEAAAFDPAVMEATFGDVDGYDGLVDGVGHGGLDPWWTYGDERYFETLNASVSGNARVDLSLLHERYYDRSESLPVVDLGNTSTWSVPVDDQQGGNDSETGGSSNTSTTTTDGNTTEAVVDPCVDGLGLGCDAPDGTSGSGSEATTSGASTAWLISGTVLVLALAGVALRRRSTDGWAKEVAEIEPESDAAEAVAEPPQPVRTIPAPPPPGGPPA